MKKIEVTVQIPLLEEELLENNITPEQVLRSIIAGPDDSVDGVFISRKDDLGNINLTNFFDSNNVEITQKSIVEVKPEFEVAFEISTRRRTEALTADQAKERVERELKGIIMGLESILGVTVLHYQIGECTELTKFYLEDMNNYNVHYTVKGMHYTQEVDSKEEATSNFNQLVSKHIDGLETLIFRSSINNSEGYVKEVKEL